MHALALLVALAGSASAVSSVNSISRKSFQVEPRLLSNSSVNSQIRLAYHGATGMTVSWNTFSQLSNPTVRYGLDPSLSQTASSSVSVTYQTSLTYNNHVTITGLKPDTTYYYLPGNNLNNSTTPYTFKTAKAAGVMDPYTIAFVCDMGNMGPEGLYTSSGKGVSPNGILAPGEKNTIDSLISQVNTYDMLLHPGDLAYADAWLKEEIGGFEPNTTIQDGYKVYESILNGYYDELQPVTAYKPYMVAPGNHEANCDNGGSNGYTASICMPGQTNFTGYINHFRMPSDVSGGVGNMWYSYDYGMVHYVFFSTETDLGNGLLSDEPPSTENAGPFGSYNQQINFLTNDLANVDRCKTPWVIALGHRPWFASGSNCANCSLAFSNLFQQYGVDLVMQGHFHVYERNYPVFPNGTTDPNKYNNPSSPWYIINGIAGHYDGMDSFASTLQPYQAFGLDVSASTYGWSRVTFYNSSSLKHEFIASNNDSVIDSTYLYKTHACGSSSSSSSTSSSSMSATTSSRASNATATSGLTSGTTTSRSATITLTSTSTDDNLCSDESTSTATALSTKATVTSGSGSGASASASASASSGSGGSGSGSGSGSASGSGSGSASGSGSGSSAASGSGSGSSASSGSGSSASSGSGSSASSGSGSSASSGSGSSASSGSGSSTGSSSGSSAGSSSGSGSGSGSSGSGTGASASASKSTSASATTTNKVVTAGAGQLLVGTASLLVAVGAVAAML